MKAAKKYETPSTARAKEGWVDNGQVNHILNMVRDALVGMTGIVGLALGGSRAYGTARDDSDIDIGLFFDITNSRQLINIYNAISLLDDRNTKGASGASELGSMSDVGRWVINGQDVDILLRDINKVKKAISDCLVGKVEILHDANRLRGISNAVYAGEVCYNIDIYDPFGTLAEMRELTNPYPEKLAGSLINKFSRDSAISLGAALPAAHRGEYIYVYGYIHRAATSLNEILFAAEGRYLINEKNSVEVAATFPIAPRQYSERMANTFNLLTIQPKDMVAAIDVLNELREDVMSSVTRSFGNRGSEYY